LVCVDLRLFSAVGVRSHGITVVFFSRSSVVEFALMLVLGLALATEARAAILVKGGVIPRKV
jgi:hypothetical protein